MGEDAPVRVDFPKRGTMMVEHRFHPWRHLLLIAACVACCYIARPVGARASDTETLAENAVNQNDRGEKITWYEIYGDSECLKYEDYNLVSDLSVRMGIHAFKILDNDLDLYLKGRLYADSKRLYWNNRYELGIGSRYRPFKESGMILFVELLYGGYTGREKEDEPNPDDSPYLDFQGGLAFWNWWGKQAWQINKKLEAYVPFTGWRELYWDCIYYDHADNDLIVTLDYKEGLLLGKTGQTAFDAYIAIEAGWDTNAYEWNNYLASGVGFRVKPFEKLDLKLGVEYLWCNYYRGGYDTVDKHVSSLQFTLELWKGW